MRQESLTFMKHRKVNQRQWLSSSGMGEGIGTTGEGDGEDTYFTAEHAEGFCDEYFVDVNDEDNNDDRRFKVGQIRKYRAKDSHEVVFPHWKGAPGTSSQCAYATTATPKNNNLPFDQPSRKLISYWHDVELTVKETSFSSSSSRSCNRSISAWCKPSGAMHFICESPMHTRLRLQLSTSEPFTPLRQRSIPSDNSVSPASFDTNSPEAARYNKHKTSHRSVNGEGAHVFSSGLLFNVGTLPRTWQDEAYANSAMSWASIVKGKNDEVAPVLYGNGRPITGVEVGCCAIAGGEVRRVKPLGAMAVVDLFQDATVRGKGGNVSEFVVVVIDQEDEWARELWTLNDLEERAPGTLGSIRYGPTDSSTDYC